MFYQPGPGGCYVCCVVVEGFGEQVEGEDAPQGSRRQPCWRWTRTQIKALISVKAASRSNPYTRTLNARVLLRVLE